MVMINVDILVNDAGQGQYGNFAEVELQRHLDIIQLNVTSLVSLTHYFLNDMIKRDEGRILQLGSEVSKIPMPLMAIYAATKAFVLSFSEGVIEELKDTNVTMTVIMPGATDTAFFNKAEMEHTKIYRENPFDDPQDVAKLAFEALMSGERRVIGKGARKNVAMAAVTPDSMMAGNMKKQMQASKKDPSETRQGPDHPRSAEETEEKTAF